MPEGKIRRVLVYRLGSLGDHLVALPAYRVARRAFPEAELRLLTNVPVAAKAAAAEALLTGSGVIDSFEGYRVGERNPLALLRLVWTIRRWRPEAMVYLAGARGVKAARRDRLFFRLCGIRRQIGLPLTEDLQRNRSRGTDAGGTPWVEPEAERLCRTIAELGDGRTADAASWALGLQAEERAAAAALLDGLRRGGFFAFSIGTKAQVNQWGEENWSAFFAELAREWPGVGLVLLGAADEAAISERIGAAWTAGPVLNLCGRTSPRISGAVLERARLFFGHDSGPAHLAAAVGAPVWQVRSARQPAGEWFPHGAASDGLMHWVPCGGCGLETCVVEAKKCMTSITVPEMLAGARAHLAKKSSSRG